MCLTSMSHHQISAQNDLSLKKIELKLPVYDLKWSNAMKVENEAYLFGKQLPSMMCNLQIYGKLIIHIQ